MELGFESKKGFAFLVDECKGRKKQGVWEKF